MTGDNEKGCQGINDSFHYIHDVSRLQFSLEFADKFSSFRLKRTNGHLDTRSQGVCLPLHPVGGGAVGRTLGATNDQALYLCCIAVIKPLQFKGFPVLIPMDTLMHDGVIDRPQISQVKCLGVNNDRLCRKVSRFHFSRI